MPVQQTRLAVLLASRLVPKTKGRTAVAGKFEIRSDKAGNRPHSPFGRATWVKSGRWSPLCLKHFGGDLAGERHPVILGMRVERADTACSDVDDDLVGHCERTLTCRRANVRAVIAQAGSERQRCAQDAVIGDRPDRPQLIGAGGRFSGEFLVRAG
jgi:hypothetical protein